MPIQTQVYSPKKTDKSRMSLVKERSIYIQGSRRHGGMVPRADKDQQDRDNLTTEVISKEKWKSQQPPFHVMKSPLFLAGYFVKASG